MNFSLAREHDNVFIVVNDGMKIAFLTPEQFDAWIDELCALVNDLIGISQNLKDQSFSSDRDKMDFCKEWGRKFSK